MVKSKYNEYTEYICFWWRNIRIGTTDKRNHFYFHKQWSKIFCFQIVALNAPSTIFARFSFDESVDDISELENNSGFYGAGDELSISHEKAQEILSLIQSNNYTYVMSATGEWTYHKNDDTVVRNVLGKRYPKSHPVSSI